VRVILKGNKKSWNQCISQIEHIYNVVDKSNNLSHFEVVYGFNPSIPLNLLPLSDTTSLFLKEGISRSVI